MLDLRLRERWSILPAGRGLTEFCSIDVRFGDAVTRDRTKVIGRLFEARQSASNSGVQPQRFEIEISLNAAPRMIVQSSASPQVHHRLPFGIKHRLPDLAVL